MNGKTYTKNFLISFSIYIRILYHLRIHRERESPPLKILFLKNIYAKCIYIFDISEMFNHNFDSKKIFSFEKFL